MIKKKLKIFLSLNIVYSSNEFDISKYPAINMNCLKNTFDDEGSNIILSEIQKSKIQKRIDNNSLCLFINENHINFSEEYMPDIILNDSIIFKDSENQNTKHETRIPVLKKDDFNQFDTLI